MIEIKTIKIGDTVSISGHEVTITEIYSTMQIDGVAFTIQARDAESAQKAQADQMKSTSLQNDMLEMLKKMFGGGNFPGSGMGPHTPFPGEMS